ncbi:MAG: Fic family protein [Ruminococcus flavefaciens]|nr:Fic family protein [Ruminococcus flavefaciens]
MSDTRELLPVLLSEKSRKIKGSIYNRMQVDFAYYSNLIEGNRLTHDQTRYIYETRTIDGTVPVNDVFEAANHFKCFDYILDTVSEPITEDYIKQLHRMLKNGVMEDDTDYAVIGDYKKYPNEVGEIQTALPEDVPGLVQNLLRKYESKPSPDLYDVAEFHAAFEKIHPFYDGNGRIGRLLMLKQCLANGIVPFFINEDKHFYYVGLKEWQSDEKKERLIDVFLSMQDDMKAILDYFRINYDKTELASRELINKHI